LSPDGLSVNGYASIEGGGGHDFTWTRVNESLKPDDGPKESEAHALLRQGREYLTQNKFLMAYERFSQAINKNPTLSWAYVDRSEAAFLLRQFDQSIDDCTEVIRRGPPEDRELIWTAYMRRGHANREKAIAGNGKQDLAIADYNNAIKRWPEQGHGYLWRGEAKRADRDREGSIPDFDEAIRLASQDDKFLLGFAFQKRGDSYREKGRAFADQAIADYTESLKHRPDNGMVYYWRGVAYELKNDRTRAANDKIMAKKLGYPAK
jgi:tetratricopeptide (TPR) repeat protein